MDINLMANDFAWVSSLRTLKFKLEAAWPPSSSVIISLSISNHKAKVFNSWAVNHSL